ITEESNPTIRQCRIYEGKKAGIFITKNSLGLIEYCQIYQNASEGIYIDSHSNPTIRQCTIKNGKSYGIYIAKTGLGRIDGCKIQANNLAGIMNNNKGNIDIIRSTIIPNKPPYGRILLVLVACFPIPLLNNIDSWPPLTIFYLALIYSSVNNLFKALEQRGFRKRFTILNLLLTIELGILGGIGIAFGFNPSMIGILLGSASLWLTMLVYRFFR
ncbi:MAG TPA: hypothetical protein DCF68_03425, partial [Cyanothece sp. UBA12306]|nr:hypothetical protein [Cyanothece sp. UBA12306]